MIYIQRVNSRFNMIVPHFRQEDGTKPSNHRKTRWLFANTEWLNLNDDDQLARDHRLYNIL